MTPADELRTAAQKIRELADRATHENRPNWTTGNTLRSRTPVVVDHTEEPSVLVETYAARLEAVNRYIAAMDPALGTVLADWLETTADYAMVSIGHPTHVVRALAVARQINGSAP